LVSDIPAGDGKSLTFFYSAMLLHNMYKDIYFRIVQILSLFKNISLLFTTFLFFILFLVNFVTSKCCFLQICLFHSFFVTSERYFVKICLFHSFFVTSERYFLKIFLFHSFFVTSERYFLKICLFHSFFAYFLCSEVGGGGGEGAYTYK